MAHYSDAPMVSLPRPGRALKGVLIALLALWLMFAVGINWAGVPEELFLLFCGNAQQIMQGEVWRLFTAPVMHQPTGTIGHILTAMFGLYFLGPSLEKQWGAQRFLRFLLLSGVIGYALQFLLLIALPGNLASKVAQAYWYGSLPVIDAVAIAWALNNRGSSVRLFFVLPVSSTGLIVFIVGANLMYLLALTENFEGRIAPFGGMFAGWLLGASTPSPARKAWLKLKLARLDAEARREGRARRQRSKNSHLRVIEGGRESEKSSDKRGPDGRWLN
ncbi:MAG TPA: rhomboid family intramembrane serine protease [Polyangiaceae bacterium]|jgi:membrane associated rhomboid family serine protease|nr:rhomboid family intramembrane serine protease [Polyangiaceae bacterium]